MIEIDEQSDYSEKLQIELASELKRSQFKQLGKELFASYVERSISYQDFFTSLAIYNGFAIPDEINEFFLTEETAVHFPSAYTPDFKQYDDWLRANRRLKGVFNDNISEIKKLYVKWATSRIAKDREYYGLSVLNVINRDQKNDNFLKSLMVAVIYTYDEKLKNKTNALNAIAEARDCFVNGAPEQKLKEKFLYFISLYEGFVYYKFEEYDTALKVFNECSPVGSRPITAYFYAALLEMKKGNNNRALDLVNSIIAFDVMRFKYALKHNMVNFIYYLLDNSVSYSLFRYPEFTDLGTEIKSLINNQRSQDTYGFDRLPIWIQNFSELRLNEYYDTGIKNRLAFLEQYFELFRNNKSCFMSIIADEVVTLFKEMVQSLKDQMKQSHSRVIKAELENFDSYVKDTEIDIDMIKIDREKSIKRFELNFEDIKRKAEQKSQLLLESYEKEYDSVDSDIEYDPGKTFKNAMTNNLIISIVMVFVGGVIGAFSVGENRSFNAFLGTGLFDGVIVGIVVYMMGTIMSALIVSTVIRQKKQKKKSIASKLERAKKQRIEEQEKLKKEYNGKLDALSKTYEDRLKQKEKEIEQAKESRTERENEIKEVVAQKITELYQRVDSIFT